MWRSTRSSRCRAEDRFDTGLIVLGDVVELLRCPHCGAGMELVDGSVRCAGGHSFDVARQGYVSLLGGGATTTTADGAAMVAARDAFLGAGHYAPIAQLVATASERAVDRDDGGAVVDLGAGTGYHLARVLDRLEPRVGLALDLSKHALRRAARAHPRIGAAACDVWGALPLRGRSAALVLCVFAPRNGPEIGRILRPGGALVVVTPTGRHLAELIGALGLVGVDERKPERLDRTLGAWVAPVAHDAWEQQLSLTHEEVEALVGMGPSARHGEPAALAQRIRSLPAPVSVTASVTVATYRRS